MEKAGALESSECEGSLAQDKVTITTEPLLRPVCLRTELAKMCICSLFVLPRAISQKDDRLSNLV